MTIKQDANSEIYKDVAAQFYTALNQADYAGLCALLDPDAKRVEPETFPLAGTYMGSKDVLEHLKKGRSTWAEGGCNPERFQAIGNRVIAFLHVHVRLKDRQDWIDGRVFDVLTIQDEKVLEFYTFDKNEDAIAWAMGIKK